VPRQQVIGCADDGPIQRVFYFCTDPAIAERWRKEDYVDPKTGRVLRIMLACRLLWNEDSAIKLSGCTGGTIKVRALACWLTRPVLGAHLEAAYAHVHRTHSGPCRLHRPRPAPALVSRVAQAPLHALDQCHHCSVGSVAL
jgi:hypothetical protein